MIILRSVYNLFIHLAQHSRVHPQKKSSVHNLFIYLRISGKVNSSRLVMMIKIESPYNMGTKLCIVVLVVVLLPALVVVAKDLCDMVYTINKRERGPEPTARNVPS